MEPQGPDDLAADSSMIGETQSKSTQGYIGPAPNPPFSQLRFSILWVFPTLDQLRPVPIQRRCRCETCTLAVPGIYAIGVCQRKGDGQHLSRLLRRQL